MFWLTRKGNPDVFEQAEEWLEENASSGLGGILNVDGVAAYIFLRRGYPPQEENENHEELQIIDYDSNLPADDGYIVGQPEWDFDEALSAICVDKLLKMDRPRFLSTDELDDLSSKLLRVYKRQHALFPNTPKKVPKNPRSAASIRISRFRNAVFTTNKGSVVGQPHKGGKIARRAYKLAYTEQNGIPIIPKDQEKCKQAAAKRARINKEIGLSVKKQAGEASIGSAQEKDIYFDVTNYRLTTTGEPLDDERGNR